MSVDTGNSRAPWRTVAALCLVQFVDVLGVTVVVTALPRMSADLAASAAEETAVVTAYAMAFGGLLLVAARLGDRIGHRRVLLAALALFGVASAVGAGAAGPVVLAAARGLQGVAAAASVPAALRLLTAAAPGADLRRRALAAWSAAGAAAGGAGFLVGGLAIELVSWRAVFWLQLAAAGLLLVAVRAAVPATRLPAPAGGIGAPSAVALAVAVGGVVTGTALLGGPAPVLAGAAVVATGALAGAVFAGLERRAAHPLVPRGAWATRELRWGVLGSAANTATTSSALTVATLHLQGPLGLSPLRAGLLLLGTSVLVVAGSAAAPPVVARLGWAGALATGLGGVAAACALLVAAPTAPGIGAAAALCGLGLGIASVAANDMGTSVPEQLVGTASGLLNTAAQLGTAVGTAVVLLVAAAAGPRAAWVAVAAGAVLAALAVLRRAPSRPADRRRGRRPADTISASR
ncbi:MULTISPECIES: MFS transporter [unclassified Blastococcus]